MAFHQTYHRNMRFFLVSITSFRLQDNSLKLKSANHGVGFEIDVVLICGDKLDGMIRWNEVVLSTQRNQNIHNWFTASANTHTAGLKHDQTVIPMKGLVKMCNITFTFSFSLTCHAPRLWSHVLLGAIQSEGCPCLYDLLGDPCVCAVGSMKDR